MANAATGKMNFCLCDNEESPRRCWDLRLPAYVCVSVDAIIDSTVTELIKVIEEHGTEAEQHGSKELREEAHESWKITLAEKYAVLKELQDKISMEKREPTEVESKEIGFLNYEIGTLADNLKNLRKREEHKA
jgi:hypothetical protein